MASKTKYLKLPFFFDVAHLQENLAKIQEQEWLAHYNTAAYENEWRCVPLRAVDGRSDHIVSLSEARYENTPILDRCPHFREVLDAFECEKTSVRLMAMGAGCRIKTHTDNGTSFDDGTARLHIPILTSPGAVFTVDGEEIHFSAGHTWYLNANLPHSVINDSPTPRIHLMLDCLVNPWLEKVFLAAGHEPDEAPKYGDPAINDANVSAIIANLLAMKDAPSRRLAENLAAIRDAGATK